jgi:hypothetical protein
MLRMLINWKFKYCYKKEWDEVKKEDFIFDWVWDLQEINWEMYYRIIIWYKEWYIKLWETVETSAKCILQEISL